MISLASAAFGVVAALAWNSAITALVRQIFGTGAQIVSLFVTTVIITTIAVIVMVNPGRVAARDAQPNTSSNRSAGSRVPTDRSGPYRHRQAARCWLPG